MSGKFRKLFLAWGGLERRLFLFVELDWICSLELEIKLKLESIPTELKRLQAMQLEFLETVRNKPIGYSDENVFLF